jgi:hypothetical protein
MGMNYGRDGPVSIPRQCKIFLPNIQTDSGIHQSSYPLDTGGSFPKVKWQRYEADHSLPSSAKVKKGPLYLHSPICLIGIVLV